VRFPGGHAAKELLADPALGVLYSQVPGNRAIQIRLLRYSRSDLLKKSKSSREYIYEITMTGKKRLIFLWERLGDLDPARATTEKQKGEVKEKLETVERLLTERLADLKLQGQNDTRL